MSTHLGDPAVEYWTSAMASRLEQERRRNRGAGAMVLELARDAAVSVAGYVGGHLSDVRGALRHGRHPSRRG